jgi:thiamine-monophosphate kinase
VLPMSNMGDIIENVAIDAWVKAFSRSPSQVNAAHESDAELIEIPGLPEQYLAITIDTVSEEILAGLYREPYTMGWVAVMASLSDLAAVGADPLGLVMSASVPQGLGPAFAAEAGRGMEDACRALGVFVLGGDSNAAPVVSLSGCAVGLVPRAAVLTRRGMRPGDAVFATGPAGAGNALALVRLAGLEDALFPEARYRPSARLSAGGVLRGRARACMDTSDGFLTTLDQLGRLNGCGFEVQCDWGAVLDPDVLALCESTGTPPWMMLAGPHGEFELVFSAPAADAEAIAGDLRGAGLAPVRLGAVRERRAIALALPGGQRADIDMAPLRNLLDTCRGDMERYLSEFRRIGRSWGLE